jgi:hypothetical protein
LRSAPASKRTTSSCKLVVHHSGLDEPRPSGSGPRLWGRINLGDEETSLVLINLPCRQLDVELRRLSPYQPASATVGELAGQFLRSCADYPPVRLILGPGEGCRLPPDGLILGSYLGGKQEPDVMLFISHEGSDST